MSSEDPTQRPDGAGDAGETAATDQPVVEIERETGRLIPVWLSTTIYAIFIPWCVVSFAFIGYSMVVQHKILAVIQTINGPWKGDPPPLEGQQLKEGLAFLKEDPRDNLLYLIQTMLQDEIDDPRMARAIVLRKATRWEVESQRRQLFDELLAHLSSEGEIDLDYQLPAAHARTLDVLIAERLANPSDSYEAGKITDVLEWIQAARPKPAAGPERRRVKSLSLKYGKRLLPRKEKRVLEGIEAQWRLSADSAQQAAADQFARMRDGQHAELSEASRRLCEEEARKSEEQYLTGRTRVTQVIASLVGTIRSERKTLKLDHPVLWDLVRLLQEAHRPARENIAEAVFQLREQHFTLIFLSQFIQKDAINPMMAVETPRLTNDEHEELLKEENLRRRLACIDVAQRIALAYCEEPFTIRKIEPDLQEAFFKDKVIRPLAAVAEDKQVGERASKALAAIQQSCARYLDQ